ncbi:MAG: hypothetical protein ACR2N6_01300 [Miltoncostaeaceae bacterium]
MVVLAVLLTWVGWHDRDEAGLLPFVMGIVLGLFALASIVGTALGARSAAR